MNSKAVASNSKKIQHIYSCKSIFQDARLRITKRLQKHLQKQDRLF